MLVLYAARVHSNIYNNNNNNNINRHFEEAVCVHVQAWARGNRLLYILIFRGGGAGRNGSLATRD